MAPYLLPSSDVTSSQISDVTSCKISDITSCLKFCFVSLLVEWWFVPLLCKMAPYLQGVAVSSSVNTLAAVAVERYVKLRHFRCKISYVTSCVHLLRHLLCKVSCHFLCEFYYANFFQIFYVTSLCKTPCLTV